MAFGPGHALAQRTTAPARIGRLSYIGQPDPGVENLRDGLTRYLVRSPQELSASMYGWTEFAEAGGLVSCGARLTENFKTLAKFVDRLLKGADTSAVPIEQVSRIALTLNLGAARNAGITVPPPVLLRADRVID